MMLWENTNIIGMSINPRIRRSSTRWAREPAIQSSAFEEWWMAWKRHSHGTSCNARWIQYSARSATSDRQEELHQPGQAAHRLLQTRVAQHAA